MAWRTVDGVEYLTRYTQENGKKKGRSLGRRSPETEAIMEQFDSTVLKARRKVATALIKHGHLKTVTVINSVNRCPTVVVPAEEVDRFAAQYVSLFALARQQGRHHMAVKKEFDAAGVEPAFEPDEVGATFYRRYDA